MTIVKLYQPSATTALADKRQVRVRISAGTVDRAGEQVMQSGLDVSTFMQAGGTVLWNHDQAIPIARCLDLSEDADGWLALVQFPPEGISDKADEIYGLVCADIVKGVSIGFMPVDCEPMDPSRPRGAQRYLSAELLEFSFVSVPAVPVAGVLAKRLDLRGKDALRLKCSASRSLPLNASGHWSPDAAARSIIAWAGGDTIDPAKARKGFLVHDASRPTDPDAYRLPIAEVIDGRLVARAAGLHAAAAHLAATADFAPIAADAQSVLAAYEARMSTDMKTRHVNVVKGVTMMTKGLYQVSTLASLLSQMDWLQDMVADEADYEGDGSPVPDMLGRIMIAMGEALTTMADEEVSELLARLKDEASETDADPVVSKFLARVVKTLAIPKQKAGRVLSQANHDRVKAAHAHVMKGVGCLKEIMDAADASVEGEDDEPSEVPDSDEEDDDPGTKSARARRARTLDLLSLTVP